MNTNSSEPNRESLLITHKIGDLRDNPPPEDGVLLESNLLEKGSTTILAGAPGLGKSLLAMQLAISGVTQEPWLGIEVIRKFKTLVLQAENGLLRLHKESQAYPDINYEDNIRVSEPPERGLRFEENEFCEDLKAVLDSQRPDVIIIDPWNSAADRDNIETVRQVLCSIRRAIGYGGGAPAAVIVHHTRKPKGYRASGRSLLHELAGSYALASAARSIFVLEAASDSPEDQRVVFHCVKNNNGPMRKPSVWLRSLGKFQPTGESVPSSDGPSAHEVALDRIRESLASKPMSRADLVAAFSGERGFSRSSIYNYVNELIHSGVCSSDEDGILAVKAEESLSWQRPDDPLIDPMFESYDSSDSDDDDHPDQPTLFPLAP